MVGQTPMNRRSLRVTAVGSVALFASLASAPDAAASGYLTARFGSDHGTPAQANTYAVYFNPAALGGTTGTTITGDLSVVLRSASYERTPDALSPSNENLRSDPNYVAANTGKATLTNLLALPFAGVHTDFGTKNFHAGYAVYVPFGGMATWDRVRGGGFAPGSTDGVQRWHNISGQILAIYNTLAVAYRIEPLKLSIGANVSPIIQKVSTVRARNTDSSDDITGSNGALKEGRSLLEASGFNIGAAIGLYYEPTTNLRFGLSYTSQPGFGESRLSGTLKTQLANGQPSQANVDFLQEFPDIIRFGAGWRATDRLDIRGDFEYVRWSVFERQCVVNPGTKCAVEADGRRKPADQGGNNVQLNIPRNWNDAVGLRVGPGYWFTDRLEGFGSLGFTTPAVPKETIDASTIDAFRLYFAIGAKYDVSKHVSIAGSYNHIYFFNVNTNGKNDQNIAAHPPSSAEAGEYNVSRTPSADGRYKSQIGMLNVNVAYTF